jgi:hypothetical protein
MKNAVFWDVTPCGACKKPMFRWNVSLILVTPMTEAEMLLGNVGSYRSRRV